MKLAIHIFCGLERTNWINPSLVMSLLKINSTQGAAMLPLGSEIRVQAIYDEQPVARARCISAQTALTAGADWLLMLDCDQTIPDDLLTLVALADKDPSINIVGAPYHCHPGGGVKLPVLAQMTGEGWRRKWSGKGRFEEVEWAGTGVFFIRCSVLGKIPKPWFKWQDKLFGDNVDCGEDIYFCRKAQRHGLKVHTHTGYLCGHYRTRNLADIANVYDAISDKVPNTSRESWAVQ